MVTISGRSTRSTTGGPSSSHSLRPTPSSDDDVFTNNPGSVNDLNLGSLRLSSPTLSSTPNIYSASTRPGSQLTPDTETLPASNPSSPSPSVRVLTPRTSTAPSVVGTEDTSSSNSSSPSALPAGLTIDFSFSISTHASPSRTPFQFAGPDFPLPSIEGTSTPARQSHPVTSSPSNNPFDPERAIPTPTRQSTASSRDNQNHASAPIRPSATNPTEREDSAASLTSALRQVQIANVSPSSPQHTPQTRFLSPNQHEDEASPQRNNSSPTPSLRPSPSPGRRRRSSSQMNQTPHNVRDEEPPEDDFNDPVFQRSFANTKNLMARLETTLGSSNLHLEPDSTIRRLREKAAELARFQCPPTRTVGFVGDSGVGKSSLLNSLLDRKGLARASNSGAACTCVVTEYHYHEQENVFKIVVEYFTSEELKTQLTEMVAAYRRHRLGPPSSDREEQKDIADRAKVASDTFQAMFRGYEHFDNGRFVLGTQCEDTVVSTMLGWTKEILGFRDDEERVTSTTVESQDDCSRLLAEYTSEKPDTNDANTSGDNNNRERSLWPFIKKIRVHVNAHILSKGLILVDLPGLRDLNSARQNVTERYILECDEIFAVCCIGRATTDVGVQAVFDLARQASLSNVGIVCTKSDEIKSHEALNDRNGSERRELEGRINRLKSAQNELNDIKAREDELIEIQQDDDLLDEERVELAGLQVRIHSKEKVVEGLKFELERYLIEARNEMVETRLRDKYRNAIVGGDVEVFCVSNELYWKHRQCSRNKALPWLELSGIIALRKYCVAMVSDSQLRIARNYMNNDVRSLVSSVELWVQSGAGTETAERKALVRETLDAIETRLKRDLSGRQGPFARIARTFAEDFEQQIYSRRRTSQWTRGAVQASRDWAGWHHSSYSAFCRNYGNHRTQTVGSRNWNKEALELMVQEITPLWNPFHDSVKERQADGTNTVVDLMDWAAEYLENELGLEDASAEILHQALESRQGLFVVDLENAFQVFKTGLRTLRNNVLSSHRTSLMGESMESAYNRCRAEGGTGSDSRRKSIIARTLSNEDLFEGIMDKFKTRFKELATELQNSIQTAVNRHLTAIGQTMDILRDENVIAESERDGEFRRRVEEEVTRIRGELPARVSRG